MGGAYACHRGQRINLWSCFSPSVFTCVQGLNSGHQSWAASTFNQENILLALILTTLWNSLYFQIKPPKNHSQSHYWKVAWSGIQIKWVEVQCCYPPSHGASFHTTLVLFIHTYSSYLISPIHLSQDFPTKVWSCYIILLANGRFPWFG